MDGLTIPSIIIRLSVMYILALALIRISGKQSIGELAAMDFVVINILGDAFDTVIYGEVSILQGVVYFVSITLLHIGVTFLTSRNSSIFRLFTPPARRLIHNGLVSTDGLQREWMRPEMLAVELRLNGEDRLEDVQDAFLEPEGKLSVIKKPARKSVQKKELNYLS